MKNNFFVFVFMTVLFLCVSLVLNTNSPKGEYSDLVLNNENSLYILHKADLTQQQMEQISNLSTSFSETLSIGILEEKTYLHQHLSSELYLENFPTAVLVNKSGYVVSVLEAPINFNMLSNQIDKITN